MVNWTVIRDVILINFFGSIFISRPIAVIVECVEPVIVDKKWLHRNMFFSFVYIRFLPFHRFR